MTAAPDVRPASHIQCRISHMPPAARYYTLYNAVWLTGPLDVRSLASAVRQVTVRYESLRTSLVEESGVVRRRVHPAAGTPDPDLSVTDSSEAGADNVVLGWLGEPNGSGQPVGLRARLLRTRPDRHLLVLVLHHSTADGRSMEILVRDLANLYNRGVDGRSPEPFPHDGYDAFVDYEADVLAARGRQLAGYWRERLAGAATAVDVSPGPAQPPVACPISLSADHAERLRRLAREERVSPFMVGLAAYGVFLSRICARSDVLVGTPVDLRVAAGLEDVVGPCVNLVPLRIAVPAGSTARRVLAAARDTVLNDIEQAELPFELIVGQADAERGAGLHPLVQATFQLTIGPPVTGRFAGLRAEPYAPSDAILAGFGPIVRPALDADLSMQARLFVDSGVSGFLRLRCDRPQAQRLTTAFAATMSRFVTAPDDEL